MNVLINRESTESSRPSLAHIDLFSSLLFFYFITLHADRLGFTLAGFNVRLNNVVALLLVVMLVSRFRLQIFSIHRKLLIALCLVSCSILLSLLFSPFKQRCTFFFCWYCLTLLSYLLLPYFLVKMWDAHQVFTLYCASFVVVGVYALLQLLFSLAGMNDPFATQVIRDSLVRPNALAYEPSFYALYMTPFITMCNFHYLTAPEKPFFCFQKLSLGKIVFFNALFLVSTATSTFVSYAFFFGILFFLPIFRLHRKRVLKFFIYFTSISVVFCVAFPFLMQTFFLKFFFHGLMSHVSFYERWVGISNAWTVFREFPILGVGLGGYPPLLKQAWLSGDSSFTFFVQQLLVRTQEVNFDKAFEPMNVFTEVLASLGIVGVSAFLYLCYICFRQAKAACQYAPILAGNLLVSMIILLIMLQINQGLLRTYTWVHFGLVFALFEKISSSDEETVLTPASLLA